MAAVGKVPAKPITEEEENDGGVAHNRDGGTAASSAAVGLKLRGSGETVERGVRDGMQR